MEFYTKMINVLGECAPANAMVALFESGYTRSAPTS